MILRGQDSRAGREGRGRTIVEKPLILESNETSKAAASYPNTRRPVKQRPSVKRERAIEKKELCGNLGLNPNTKEVRAGHSASTAGVPEILRASKRATVREGRPWRTWTSSGQMPHDISTSAAGKLFELGCPQPIEKPGLCDAESPEVREESGCVALGVIVGTKFQTDRTLQQVGRLLEDIKLGLRVVHSSIVSDLPPGNGNIRQTQDEMRVSEDNLAQTRGNRKYVPDAGRGVALKHFQSFECIEASLDRVQPAELFEGVRNHVWEGDWISQGSESPGVADMAKLPEYRREEWEWDSPTSFFAPTQLFKLWYN
ncbi:hypothetical protein B0H14DRAFT_2615143 [Mycena olivaceomarginata]|nr:hypothetical protein B0H14DRAFT_2615143 [Mycena olivaceomarginata]